MKESQGFSSFNLGNGSGFSVMDIIKSCENVTGESIDYIFSDRREGDPDILVADSSKARNILGWETKLSSINSIISSVRNTKNQIY